MKQDWGMSKHLQELKLGGGQGWEAVTQLLETSSLPHRVRISRKLQSGTERGTLLTYADVGMRESQHAF